MGAFLVKQPNGLYCRFSTVVDCPTHYNLTEQDYIDVCIERSKEQAIHDAQWVMKNNVKTMEEMDKYFSTMNMSQEEYDELKKKMAEPPTEE